jgi:hypothetical protein
MNQDTSETIHGETFASKEEAKKKMIEIINSNPVSSALICFVEGVENKDHVDVMSVYNNMNGAYMLHALEWLAYSILKVPALKYSGYPFIMQSILNAWTKLQEDQAAEKSAIIVPDNGTVDPIITPNVDIEGYGGI